MSSPKGYRDSIYIIKDIILTLVEYGELNQTALISYCGLNLTKHRHILEGLEENQMIEKFEVKQGKRLVTMFKVTSKGMDFCNNILEPYEDIFPRKIKSDKKTGLSLIFI